MQAAIFDIQVPFSLFGIPHVASLTLGPYDLKADISSIYDDRDRHTSGKAIANIVALR